MAGDAVRKKTRFNMTVGASVCVTQGKGSERGPGGGGEKWYRNAILENCVDLCTHVFLRRWSVSVMYSMKTSARPRRVRRREDVYSRSVDETQRRWRWWWWRWRRWRSHTHTRGSRTLFPFRSARNLSLTRAMEKQHPASFFVPIYRSSFYVRGRCIIFLSLFFTRLLACPLSHSASPVWRAGSGE